jgi:hypothetical protein
LSGANASGAGLVDLWIFLTNILIIMFIFKKIERLTYIEEAFENLTPLEKI